MAPLKLARSTPVRAVPVAPSQGMRRHQTHLNVVCQAASSSRSAAAAPQGGRMSLADTLLNRAASRVERGTCTCLNCRGGGTTPCGACQGDGHLSAGSAQRAHVLHDVFHRMRVLVGLSSSSGAPYASDGRVTNRCQRCHGKGRLLCDSCSGSGLRYPHLTADHYRQCAGQHARAGEVLDCPLPEPQQRAHEVR